MTPSQRRLALEKIATDGRFAQFGQSHDGTTSNGSEACTHVCLQYLIKVWRDLDVTIDEISKVAGYKTSDEGMNSTHVDLVLKHYKLPYVASWRSGAPPCNTADQLIQLSRQRGPLLLAINYGVYPLDKNLKGHVSSQNGFMAQGGRSDMSFAGDHAIILNPSRWRRKAWHPRSIDPDHGSPSRPKVPNFDIMSAAQLDRIWATPLLTRTSNGSQQKHVAYLPTKEWSGAK